MHLPSNANGLEERWDTETVLITTIMPGSEQHCDVRLPDPHCFQLYSVQADVCPDGNDSSVFILPSFDPHFRAGGATSARTIVAEVATNLNVHEINFSE